MKKLNNKITKQNFKNFTAREIIEDIVMNPKKYQEDRKYKYFLGEVVSNKLLNSYFFD